MKMKEKGKQSSRGKHWRMERLVRIIAKLKVDKKMTWGRWKERQMRKQVLLS